GKQVEVDADQPEKKSASGQAECDRKTEQQEEHQPREHDRGEVLQDERHHGRLSALRAAACFCAKSSSVFLRISAARSSANSSSALFCCFLRVGSSINPCRNAKRLISSETPCSASSA